MSELKVNKISPATGTAFTLGDSGDTFTVPSGATIVNSGTATNFGSSWTHLTEQTTTSGTGVTFTGIPAAVTFVKVIFHTVDGNGTGDFLDVRIGDSGGIESSGYRGSTSGFLITAGGSHAWSGDGIEIVDASTVADDYQGVLTITRMNSGEHKWVTTSMVAGCPALAMDYGAGTKTLTGELTQLQILSSVTLQDGAINVLYM